MYGQPSNSKTECHLLCLHEPIDCTLPIKVMFNQIEEVQQFLTANPDSNQEMSKPNLIQFAVIKAGKTCLYTKALKHLRAQDPADHNAWTYF